MDAIREPHGSYNQPPVGKIPPFCPHCGGSLAHFLQRSVPNGPPPAPGDLYIPPEPALVRPTELQQIQQVPPRPVALPPEPSLAIPPGSPALNVLDDPQIGGKITVCVLLFGAYHNLHRRCLTSLLSTVPPSRMDLRVGCNQVTPDTLALLATLPITKVYPDNHNRRKYPAMRQMFWDPNCPINTKWIVWFDDDTWVKPECSRWLVALAQKIIAVNDPRLGMLGMKRRHPIVNISAKHDPRNWFKHAPWWKSRPFQTAMGQPAPNGREIHFITGGFWALRTEAMQACDIPDKRLNHNGGDICIGEQLWQGNYTICDFNGKKEIVATNDSPRRGFRERFPWYAS